MQTWWRELRVAWLIAAALAPTTLAGADALSVHVESGPPATAIAVPASEIGVRTNLTNADEETRNVRGSVDGKHEATWCRAVGSPSVPPSVVTFTFHRPQRIDGVGLAPFLAADFAAARDHGRIKALDVTTDAGRVHVELPDFVARVEAEDASARAVKGVPPCEDTDSRIRGVRYFLRFGHVAADKSFVPSPIVTSRVVLTLKRAYKGKRSPAACISRVSFFRQRPDRQWGNQ
jgi:hypothetical protein